MTTPTYFLNHPIHTRVYSFKPLGVGSYVEVVEKRGPRTVSQRRVPVGEARRLYGFLRDRLGYVEW